MYHPRNLDKPIAALVAKLPAASQPIMLFASWVAAPPAIAIILALVIVTAFVTQNEQLLRSSLLVLVLSPVAELSKLITRRRRPETLYVENMRFKTYSFPSGHSYISALVFGFLAVIVLPWHPYAWLITVSLIALILLVGISRIYLGAHFPSDVIVGWALGSVVLYTIYSVGLDIV